MRIPSGLKLHALLDLARTLHGTLGDALDQCGIVFAVAIGGCHRHGHGVAVLLAFEGFFQPRDQIAVSLDVGERFRARRGVDDGAGVVFQGVMNEHYSISIGSTELTSLRDRRRRPP
jgi:hypothetical protein